MATLADLITDKSVQQLFQQLLGVYQSEDFPTSAWQTGGTDRTRTMAYATVLRDIASNYVPAFARGVLLGLSDGDWLELLAAQNFSIAKNLATFTHGTIRLTATTGTGPYTIAAGDLKAVFGATGNGYFNVDGGTLTLSGTLDLEWIAEQAGADYNDASNSGALTLATPLPGVALSNPADDYTDVGHVGAGTGTITPSGSPVGPHQVVIRIDSTGAVGVASWSSQVDGGAYVSHGSVASASDLGGAGIDVTLVNGVSGTSFVEDDTYLFYTPGSWITEQGSDDETDAALTERCQNRWPSLSDIPTMTYFELLARSVPDVGSQVVHVIVLDDENVNDRVNIVVSGPEGPLPPATVADIQDFISPRTALTRYPTVVSPTTSDITYVATITVTFSQFAAAQDALDVAWRNYTNGAGINPTLRIAELIDRAMEIGGVVDISGVTINGGSTNLTLGSSTSFVVPVLLAINVTWVTTSG